MAARAGQVRVDVIANARQARDELTNFSGSVRNVEHDIRFLHKAVAAFGILQLARPLIDLASAQSDWNVVMEQTIARFGLAESEAAKFRTSMDHLKTSAGYAGISQQDFASALTQSGDAVARMHGTLSVTDAILNVFSRTIDLTYKNGGKFGDNLNSVVDTMQAFQVPAQNAGDVIDGMSVAAKDGHLTLTDLGKALSDVADSALRAGTSLSEVLSLVSALGPAGVPVIKAAAETLGSAKGGNVRAEAALGAVGESKDSSLTAVTKALITYEAAANDATGAAKRLAAISGGIISETDIVNAGLLANRLNDVKTALDDIRKAKEASDANGGKSAVTPPAPKSAREAFGDSYSQNLANARAGQSSPWLKLVTNVLGAPAAASMETIGGNFGTSMNAFGENINAAVFDQPAPDTGPSLLSGVNLNDLNPFPAMGDTLATYNPLTGNRWDGAPGTTPDDPYGIKKQQADIAAAVAAGAIGDHQIGDSGGGHYTRLAAGGIVNGPLHALVGEAGPEAVIPLSRMADMIRAQNTPTFGAPSTSQSGDAASGKGGFNVHGDVHVNLPGVKRADKFAAGLSDEFTARYRALGGRKERI